MTLNTGSPMPEPRKVTTPTPSGRRKARILVVDDDPGLLRLLTIRLRASNYLWPIIETRVRFVQAVQYRQQIVVSATLMEWENRLRIDYLIRDARTGARLTTGHTIQCAVDAQTHELQLVSPAPLLERLKAYL